MDELSAAQNEVRNVIRQINAAWLAGHLEQLDELFHNRMANVSADGRRYAEGKAACVDGYRSFCREATITHYQESDWQVDVYNSVAVAGYYFEIEYIMGGQSIRDTGRDTFVLERDNDRWLAVWRQLAVLPGS
jgi:Domain of unknown function (DUF4440)